MVTLFDQEYATKVYGREQARLGKIAGLVEAFRDVGISFDEIIHRIAIKFGLSQEKASEYVRKFWYLK